MDSRAITAVAKAKKSGELICPDACTKCGRQVRLHAHHEDYAKPLCVEWLCPKCHSRRHAKSRPNLTDDTSVLTIPMCSRLKESIRNAAKHSDRTMADWARLLLEQESKEYRVNG